MSILTSFLNLFKYDPVANKDSTFNITTALNENWDKIDAKVKEVSLSIENIEVPVTSVNSMTGDVTLSAADVGAETTAGAQAKVDALAGEGNTKTVKQLDDEAKTHLAENDQQVGDLSVLGTLPRNLAKTISERGVNVKDFGAVGDGNVDDTNAIEEAINYARTQKIGKALPLYFPPDGVYRTTRPITMFYGMQFYSSLNNSEFKNKAVIRNTVTDMFTFPDNDVTDINFIGISFEGNATNKNTNFIQAQDRGTGRIIKYSYIGNCGFNSFRRVIDGRILGTHIIRNYINNGLGSLDLAGADSIISHNFIDNASAIPKDQFLVRLRHLSLSRFENNFLTGSVPSGQGCMPLMVDNCFGLVISQNWFDYSEASAVYFFSSSGNTIRDNFTRQNCRAPFDQYSAIFTLMDCEDMLLTGNQFINQPTDVNTFAFRKSVKETKNITIRDNIYKNHILKLHMPAGQSIDIFIDEPTQAYNKGKMWFGDKWGTPIVRKKYLGLSMTFGAFGEVTAQSSRSYDVTLADDIPADCMRNIRFSTATPLESGIICEVITDGTNVIKLKFTNVKSSSVTLANKTYNLMFMY